MFLTDPLIFHVMDKDTISYDDAIGSVLVSLKPLVCGPEHDRSPVITGWFPITDSLEGTARFYLPCSGLP